MGNRISIQFCKGKECSVVLFDHWGGKDRLRNAKDYVTILKKAVGNHQTTPRDRLEPNTIMLDYFLQVCREEKLVSIDSRYYLGCTENDGDNYDNGHYKIRL